MRDERARRVVSGSSDTGGEPRFSIITAAFNSSATIEATIASVLAQTRGDWEMIVADDGSTDDTAAVVERAAHGDPRIRVVQRPNGGSAAARNTAIAVSKGEFLCILDSDDRYQPNYLESMSAFIDDNPGRDIYSCNGYFVFPNGLKVPVRKGARFKKKQSFSIEQMLEGNMVFIMAVLRRSAAERVGGFREGLRLAEDYDTWLRVMLTGGKQIYNPERLGLYGITEGSCSVNFDGVQVARLEILEYMEQEFPDGAPPGAYEHALERQRKRLELSKAERRLAQGDSRGMRAAFFRSWSVLPTRIRKYVGGALMMVSPRLYRRVFIGRLYKPSIQETQTS